MPSGFASQVVVTDRRDTASTGRLPRGHLLHLLHLHLHLLHLLWRHLGHLRRGLAGHRQIGAGGRDASSGCRLFETGGLTLGTLMLLTIWLIPSMSLTTERAACICSLVGHATGEPHSAFLVLHADAVVAHFPAVAEDLGDLLSNRLILLIVGSRRDRGGGDDRDRQAK